MSVFSKDEDVPENMQNGETNVFRFFDVNYEFKSFKSKDNKKHKTTKRKLTEYALSVISKEKKEEEYRVLHKNGDDMRKDFLIFQSLELIKKVGNSVNVSSY